jgi:hypothetical protein
MPAPRAVGAPATVTAGQPRMFRQDTPDSAHDPIHDLHHVALTAEKQRIRERPEHR